MTGMKVTLITVVSAVVFLVGWFAVAVGMMGREAIDVVIPAVIGAIVFGIVSFLAFTFRYRQHDTNT